MNTEIMRQPPKQDDLWVHYKGGKYQIICIATETDTGQPFVVYRALSDSKIWVRMLFRFMSKVTNAEVPDGVWRYVREE